MTTFKAHSIGDSSLRIGLLSLLFFGAPARAANVNSSSPSRNWIEVADFLVREEDREGFLQLQEKILRERPSEIPLVTKILEYHLRNKDRKALLEVVNRLHSDLRCDWPRVPRVRRPACDELKRLWVGNLDSVLFFEDSARRLVEARSLIAQKDCPSAVGVLKEIEAREGASKLVLTLMEEGLKCAGDTEAAAKAVRRLEEIRIFSSGATDT